MIKNKNLPLKPDSAPNRFWGTINSFLRKEDAVLLVHPHELRWSAMTNTVLYASQALIRRLRMIELGIASNAIYTWMNQWSWGGPRHHHLRSLLPWDQINTFSVMPCVLLQFWKSLCCIVLILRDPGVFSIEMTTIHRSIWTFSHECCFKIHAIIQPSSDSVRYLLEVR